MYTVCSHGNVPRPKFPNYQIFINYTYLFNETNILGECYLTIWKLIKWLQERGQIKKFEYLSDTYRRDIDWIGHLRNASSGDVVYILIHPDNWIYDLYQVVNRSRVK